MSGREAQLVARLAALRQQVAQRDPAVLARNTGSVFDEGCFYLPYWGRQIRIEFPALIGRDDLSERPLDTVDQAMLAYYFVEADGSALTDRWISFSELPDGQFYTQAFQSYSGAELARQIGPDYAGFAQAARRVGGRPEPFADSAFAFLVLPRVALLAACWEGDEEFPPSYRLLFDAAAGRHLTTDACAILGSSLTRRLLGAYRELQRPDQPPT